MTKDEWQAAEQTLRSHFTKRSKELLEVKPEEGVTTLGAAFWVRYKAGGGGLVLVRGKNVYAERGMATVAAILKADQLLVNQQISAADFYYLLENLGKLPELPADPFNEYKIAELNPQWVFPKGGKGDARFVLYSPNPKASGPPRRGGGGGAPIGDSFPVVRATLKVTPKYALSWKVEETSYPFPAK